LKKIKLASDARAMVPTPSGDRIYVALAESPRIAIVDRYREQVAGAIELPSAASDLRIDPFGQSLLAKPAAGGDSAWVIDIGTGRVTGSIPSEWSTDLPAFAPSRTIATLRGADVVFVDETTLRTGRTVSGGAKDYWYFFAWNGFRPRAANLDQPVTFGSGDSARLTDTMTVQPTDSSKAKIPMRDAAPSVVPPMVLPPPAAPGKPVSGFIVSFAAVLNEQSAKALAASIQVDGAQARVSQTQSGGTAIFRVILGPYATREEAERIGRDSRRQYWVYEGST
jgi:hypothetical protein